MISNIPKLVTSRFAAYNILRTDFQHFQVVRDPGPAKIDKIILLYKFTDAANPRDAFKENDEGTT